jgi:hypothetical protein
MKPMAVALIEAAMIGLEITVKLDAIQHADYLARLDSIVSLLQTGNTTEASLMSILDDIESELQQNTSVASSLETLIANLHAAGSDGDPTRLKAVLETLKANDARIIKLVTDNTPVATPGPAPDPAPVVNPL